MDHYFDLHFHPVAKNHLGKCNRKVPKERGIAELTGKIEMSKGFMDYTDEVILRILESQCSTEQLEKGKVTLGVAAISALEFGIASSKSFFSDLIKNGLAKPFNIGYFDAVREGEVSYLNLFLKELAHYLKLEKAGKVEVLNNESTRRFNENSVKLALAIEGGHNLSMKKIGNALVFDEFKDFAKEDIFDPKTVSSKTPSIVLKDLVSTLRGKEMDVLYLTLTHLTHIPEQHLATHAFGTKMLKHPSFYPFGNGLSDLGKEVIDSAYSLKDKDGASPVLIDIKHMSLKSRQDFYDYRKRKGYGKIPIIASHVGVTGYATNVWKDRLDLKKTVNHMDQGIKTVKIRTKPKVAGYWGSGVKTEFAFNPCTINLMDEDIIEVVNSNGIIGVGLDVNLLGYESKSEQITDTYEFLSTADFIHHFPYTSIRALDFADTEEILSEEAWLTPAKKEMHPLSFCLNIVHIIAVIGLKTNKKYPEKYICVGSDFDGFIEPIKICTDSRQMNELESNLLKWLPVAAKRYQKENGGTADLFPFTQKKKDLEEVVKAILYQSGKDFVIDHFVSKKTFEDKPVDAV